jgi:hypothetical protein
MTPRPDPRLFITPETAIAIDALTLGQVMRLLQARGGDMARAWIAELRIAAPDGFRGADARRHLHAGQPRPAVADHARRLSADADRRPLG